MSQHGCPERLSNRSKGFQDEGPSQSTMEVLVETLTGTAFEMTVSPSDTIFAIKSKIFRVEGIPVAQQHLLYNLKELDDASSLHEHAISDGARLRLVLGMRGGPISTRRLPPPPNTEPWRDIERLLDSNREDGDWGSSGSGGSGCKVTVLVFRDGERVNMLRVRENHDGTYSPIDHNKYSSSLTHLVEHEQEIETDDGLSGSLHENAVTMGKMMELRRRMENLNVSRGHHNRNDKVEMQKTRSEETLSVNSLLEDGAHLKRTLAFAHDDDTFAPLCDGSYTRYDYDCSFADRYTLLPPIGTRTDSDQSVQEAVAESERLKLSDALSGSILVKGGRREAREEEAAILEECLDADDCHLRPASPQLTANNLAPIAAAEYVGPVVGGEVEGWRAVGFGVGPHSHSASSLHAVRPTPAPRHHPPLSDALFSSSTSDLEKLKRNSRILPALSRHRNREHLHLSDEGLDLSHHGIPHPLEVGSERRHTTSKNLEVGGDRQNRTSYPLEVGGERQNKTSYSLEVGGERQNRTSYPLEVGGERRNRISYPLEIGGERQNRTLYSQELNKEKCQNLSFQVGGERQNRTSYSLDIDANRNQNKTPQPLEIGIEKQNLTAYHLEEESERRQNRTSHSLQGEERQYRTSYPLEGDGERHPHLEVGGERKCRAQNRTSHPLEIASEKSVSRTPNSLLGERCQDLSSPTKGRLFRVEDDPSLKEVEVKQQEVKEKERKIRIRCGFCRKRLSIATVHRCRCGATFCAPHRYAEVHGCLYDYKAQAHAYLAQANPLVSAPKLPKI